MDTARSERRPIAVRTSSGLSLSVHVLPGASKAEFAGAASDQVRVRLQSRAVEGQANKALAEFLGRALGLPKSCITIVRGATSRDKVVHLEGDADAIARLLSLAISDFPGI